MSRSFTQGVGRWHGGAEVYDGHGAFAGMATDSRTVVADDGAGTVTVDVAFEGPFGFGGRYTIVDKGEHRVYQGPLNYGFAETLGQGLVSADNYWHQIGMNQKFMLMVLPDDTTQLSFALINRGERHAWSVVGEYQRVTDDGEFAAVTEPVGGPPLLDRPGTWSGTLTRLGDDLTGIDTLDYSETVTSGGEHAHVELAGVGWAPDTGYDWHRDGDGGYTPVGSVVGSGSLSGGRAISGTFLHHADEVRCWRREIATRDGSRKGVLHTWYRGGQRLGMSHGVLDFTPE